MGSESSLLFQHGSVHFGKYPQSAAPARYRDLQLSAQARAAIQEIDDALERIKKDTYGISVVSGLPIPKERLEAIPHADKRVEEKATGMSWR